MEIISKFVMEQKRYSKEDLKKIFHFSVDEIDAFIRKLKVYGVLKTVKNVSEQLELSDLVDEDIEVTDAGDTDCLFVFTYVGIIAVGSRIIKCYPKYVLNVEYPLEEMKQVLKVITRYGSKEQIINLYNGDSENSTFNFLAVILFLLNDYHDYGIYNNTEDIIEINGEGEILWDRTVNGGSVLINNNRPYYMEMFTGKTVDDNNDLFKRIHECVLTDCSKRLEISGLIDLFDIVEVHLAEEEIDDLGDVDYILYQLQSELNVQFNTRKQLLLKTLYAYIAHKRTMEDNLGISMFGTNSFNLVWEDVCSEVFDNKLKIPLGQLNLPTRLKENYRRIDRLIDIIQKPIWSSFNEAGKGFDKIAKDTLIPDIVTIAECNSKHYFNILDAKYYNIQLEENKPLRGQPGVGDVIKQYMYQLAYKDFIIEHGIKEVRNCFILPTQDDDIVEKGLANMHILSALGLKDIQILQMPAKIMYDLYLRKKTIDITQLYL